MGIPCRSTAPGAKADPSQNPEPPPNRTRGGCSYGSEHAPANTPLWVFPVGAPPPVRKRGPVRTPSQRQSHPRRVLLRFRARPGQHAAMGLCVGAPPPVRKRTPVRTPSQPQSHPRRVLLRLRARPANTPLRVFHVGAPPPVRKRSQARTPSHPQSHPGRVLLQPVTPGGDPAQSTIAAAQPKAISGRL